MSALDQFRAQKDDFFQHDWQSPLTADQREGFIGLKYYPENPALRLTLPIEPHRRSRNRHDDHQHRQRARICEVRAILV